LPSTLDDTYERILSAINEDDSIEVKEVLEWVAFAKILLSLEELEETIAIDMLAGPLPQYKSENKPLDKRYLLEICPGFLQVNYVETANRGHSTYRLNTVHISHFSVKEFLCSERLRKHNSPSRYSLEAQAANLHIGEGCLAYVLHWKGNFKSKGTELGIWLHPSDSDM